MKVAPGAGRELDLVHQRAGPRVVEQGVAEARARDPEAVALELETGRGAHTGRAGDEDPSRAGAEVAGVDGPRPDRADVERVSRSGLDPLGREPVRERDLLRKHLLCESSGAPE